MFNSNNCEIIVTGNINSNDLEYLQNKFNDIFKAEAKLLNDIKPKNFLKRQSCHDRLYSDNMDFAKVGLTFDVDLRKTSRIEVQFLQNALCKGLLAPFTMRLREKLGLLHEIQSNTEFFSFGGLMNFIFEVRIDDTLLLLDELTKLFVEQRAVLDIKAFDCVYAAFSYGMQNLFDEPNSFAYELIFDSTITTPKNYIERNKQITYEQVCKAAKEIFKPQNLIISIITPTTTVLH